jgi:hypothetical protein
MIEGFMPSPNFVLVEDIKDRIPEEHADKFKGIDWENVNFTTFSICETSMLDYEITSEGDIYIREENLLEKINYTGELDFHALLTRPDFDLEVSFKALFFKGELKEFDLDRLKELDQSVRKSAQKKIMKVIQKEERLKKSWLYKPLSAYRQVVGFTLTCVRWVFALFIKACWAIETKIT